MSENEIYRRITLALDKAPRNQFTVELHLQMLKHADELKHITEREFCEGVGFRPGFGTKSRNLVKCVI